MDSKVTYAIIAVVIIAVAGVAVFFALGNGSSYEPAAYDDSDVRLRIYGNANGDDVIDDKDVKTIQKIIDEDIKDWKTSYYFADANHDGSITSADVDVVNKFIKKESTKMWYENSFSTKDSYADGVNKRIDSYVNYPIGHKVGCEYLTVQFLCVLGVYDYFKATDATTVNNYGEETYPGITSIPSMGQRNALDLQSLEQMYKDGKLDTVIMWSGGTSTMYLWDDAVKSGVADDISFVMLTCQGKDCVNGVLMLAAMFGDQSLSTKYVKWYDSGMQKLNEIGKSVKKKTVLTIQMFQSTTQSGLQSYKQYQPPVLWFSQVINFVGDTAGSAGFHKHGSAEALQKYIEDYNVEEMIAMTQPSPDGRYENYNKWVEDKMNELFKSLPIYENQKIYTIDFDLMPYFGGPAACYLLAAQLYPDNYSMEDAFSFAQEYIDNFNPTSHNAKQGYTYTGSGYYPYKG